MKQQQKLLLQFFAFTLFILTRIAPANAQKPVEVKIRFSNIKNTSGTILLNVFKDPSSYEKQEVYKQIKISKKNILKGNMESMVSLEEGVCGLTIIDDENNNGKLDKNIIGIPKEGFGFSNFVMTKKKKPDFDDFKIDIPASNAGTSISIAVTYM